MKKTTKKILWWTAGTLTAAGLMLILLIYHGILPLNNPPREDYPVRGVDVSSYQGDIDWAMLAQEDIQFAFIKATEGSGFQDPCFQKNLTDARQTGLRVGAYHFFSYDSPGLTQYENYISAVPKFDRMLPPVVDIEFYGDKEKNLPDAAAVSREMKILLDRLEDYYGMKPIIYATAKSYRLYVRDDFPGYDIWIRGVYLKPSAPENWTFWQFTNRARLHGYDGPERYIDLNVWYGTQAQFDAYPG